MNDMGVEIDTKSGLRNRWTHRRLEMVQDWANDYQAFEAWCKEHGWQEGSPIKRIRYDELMGPDNCRIIDGIDTYVATPGYSNRPCLQCQRGTDECCTVAHECTKYMQHWDATLRQCRVNMGIEREE